MTFLPAWIQDLLRSVCILECVFVLYLACYSAWAARVEAFAGRQFPRIVFGISIAYGLASVSHLFWILDRASKNLPSLWYGAPFIAVIHAVGIWTFLEIRVRVRVREMTQTDTKDHPIYIRKPGSS